MRRIVFVLMLVMLAALPVAGCLPESRNPVGPLVNAIEDERLFGVWFVRFEDENIVLHILKDRDRRFDLAVVSHRADGAGAIDLYQGYVSAAGDRRFISLQSSEDSGADISNPELNYLIASYELDGNERLTVRFLTEQPLVDAIAAGRLAGEVTDNGDELTRSVLLTSDSEQLSAYLAAGDPALILDDALVFQRLILGR